jgi:predicted amino acid racemase
VSSPRLEIRLDLIERNARALVGRLRPVGISVSGVTKASLGDPQIATAMISGGVGSLSDSRVENVERLRRGGVTASIALIRSPMVSQADRVVAATSLSLNSELLVMEHLAAAARRQRRHHGVVIMVELGDLREGVMPADLHETIRRARSLDNIVVQGIGTNLTCQSGVIPDSATMEELSGLATSVERSLGISFEIVSGGNSANLRWALAEDVRPGRINHLRLGESILLGCDPIDRSRIAGLHQDAFEVVAEVIEAKEKPTTPWGEVGQAAFGAMDNRSTSSVARYRVIVALGRQDLDPAGLVAPPGVELLGSSSDHLILGYRDRPPMVGDEVRFTPDYRALLGAMTSPFLVQRHLGAGRPDVSDLKHSG